MAVLEGRICTVKGARLCIPITLIHALPIVVSQMTFAE